MKKVFQKAKNEILNYLCFAALIVLMAAALWAVVYFGQQAIEAFRIANGLA